MQQILIKVNPSSSWSWAWPSSAPACFVIFVKNSRGGREVNMINTLSKLNLSKIGWEEGGSTSIWIMSLNILGGFWECPLATVSSPLVLQWPDLFLCYLYPPSLHYFLSCIIHSQEQLGGNFLECPRIQILNHLLSQLCPLMEDDFRRRSMLEDNLQRRLLKEKFETLLFHIPSLRSFFFVAGAFPL